MIPLYVKKVRTDPNTCKFLTLEKACEKYHTYVSYFVQCPKGKQCEPPKSFEEWLETEL